MLNEIYYYHFRMLPNAHLINTKFCPGNPETNRFGNTRFATHAEGKTMLDECFSWDVNANRPQDGKCPMIFLGHDLRNETESLNVDIGFDPNSSDTLVAYVDTQRMAREMGIYNSTSAGQRIGLRDLAAHFEIPYRDSHTAGNDAAYTTFAAVFMALYGKNKPTFTKTVTEVVDDVEATSVLNSHCTHGIPRFCTRCHSKNHFRRQCEVRLPPCTKCQARRPVDAAGKQHGVFYFTAGRKAHLTEDCSWGSS